jgi:hypothetical protein
VAAYEIGLKLIELMGGNSNVRELAEPGVDSVDRLVRLDGLLYPASALKQSSASSRLQTDPHPRISGNPHDVLNRERLAIEHTF